MNEWVIWVIGWVDVVLLAFMVVIAIAISRSRSLFAAVMLAGIFSLLSAAMFTLMDAVDVAFTEAAVGAGISTVLMIGTLALTTREEKAPVRRPWWPLIVVLATGALLVYGTENMPHYGNPAAPVHVHVGQYYIEKSEQETGLPNIVTSVLASYRGYDTLGETAVIFTAGIGVLLLLGGSRVGRDREESE